MPELTDDLLNTIDQPLQSAKDAQKNIYLLCDYNRDGDSYRSPWTSTYDPPLDDGVQPPPHLRAFEGQANSLFDLYKTQYYEGGASSVYCWELGDSCFAACVLFKKGEPPWLQAHFTLDADERTTHALRGRRGCQKARA